MAKWTTVAKNTSPRSRSQPRRPIAPKSHQQIYLIAFLLNWLRSHDILYRFMQNGMDTQTLANIVNHHWKPTKGHAIIINTLCKITQKTMRDSGYERWTVNKHKAGTFY
ncbi:uncharacterized protein K460DRAFT_350697 [Cucurbitaria berberidis CBS 394.84]|uniref:Uncharacterized protein n=1 Tax=Cucurbitaria berberidis CBS 394.84 TaxID=1168544 RepID=A0A9P4LE14_9PLEO|nr:uncharacterized protein K460DRAFT_350697 [Cucurbitaria berberidis CBS 394.84]KAF1850669.1 hypothetical protein K460DRAFT_350697 [Cucurbitaria berberidis CBS 394.84]